LTFLIGREKQDYRKTNIFCNPSINGLKWDSSIKLKLFAISISNTNILKITIFSIRKKLFRDQLPNEMVVNCDQNSYQIRFFVAK